MKPTIDNLKGAFTLGYDAYLKSRLRSDEVHKMFHNQQWSDNELYALQDGGRPCETFNVIRMFTRQLMGYYSTVSNTIRVNPSRLSSVATAALLNDTIAYIDYKNNTPAENERLRLNCFLSGLMVNYLEPRPRKDRDGNVVTDEFGRVVYDIKKTVIHPREIILDPMSTEEDYSDARFIHRYKWMPEEAVKDMFPGIRLSKLDANSESIASAVFENHVPFQNIYKDFDNYLIVHSIIKDGKKNWSVYWSGDVIIKKTEITHSFVKFPYQVVKLQDTEKPEYYGIFEDVIESQKAINQALTQIQLLTNSNKIAVRKGAIKEEEWDDFKKTIVRVNAIFELDDIEQDIKILNMSGDIAQQYLIIDKALDRIQRVLGVNDSFLGMAFASDSGRKVKLQQNATMMALRYLDVKFNLMFKLIGQDEVNLVKQYYRASQLLRITDENVGERWIAINQPLIHPETNAPVYHEEIDPETGDFAKDEFGNYLLTPLNHPDTDLQFADTDIELITVAYNDDDEKSQLMIEEILSGEMGLELRRYNPAAFLAMSGKLIGEMKFRHSKVVQRAFEETAALITPQQPGGAPLDTPQMGGGHGSATLKLPTNTNEGA